MKKFMQKLRNSGYDEKFRLEIAKSSLNGFQKILENNDKGIKPIYRSKSWKEKSGWNEKRKLRRKKLVQSKWKNSK